MNLLMPLIFAATVAPPDAHMTASAAAQELVAPPTASVEVIHQTTYEHGHVPDTHMVCGVLSDGTFYVVMAVNGGKQAKLLYRDKVVSMKASKLCEGRIMYTYHKP